MTSRTATAAQIILQVPLEVLRFDAFKLFPRRRLLLQNDAFIHIGDRAFDLLLALASHAGEILPHNELIGTVWPKRVVADCNLKAQVGALQKILGLAPDGRRYIKSVALRGYVFVADVHMVPWHGFVLPGVREEAPAAQVCN